MIKYHAVMVMVKDSRIEVVAMAADKINLAIYHNPEDAELRAIQVRAAMPGMAIVRVAEFPVL